LQIIVQAAPPSRYLVLGTWQLVPGTWHLVPGAWYLVLGAWHLVLGTWYQVQGIMLRYTEALGGGDLYHASVHRSQHGTRCQIPGTRYLVPGTRYRLQPRQPYPTCYIAEHLHAHHIHCFTTMSETCPKHVQNISQTCPKHVPNMSQTYPGHVLNNISSGI
jgi:hypothetical protein